LLVRNRLAEAQGDAGSTTSFASRRSRERSTRRLTAEYAVAAVAMFLPLTFGDVHLRQAQEVPAYALIFVSIVAVTGYSGQISLRHAGYAGPSSLFFDMVSVG